MNKIYRNNANLRAIDGESRTISGYAVVFDSWSRDLGGFEEIIRPSAISQELLDRSNIIMNINHDDTQMVARWKEGEGTLRLELREDGLYFEFDAPETERGNELLWNVRNGNLYECSFAFSLPNNDSCQRWYRDGNNLKREIFEIGGLYDCSIVNTAAYPATSVSNREEVDVEAIVRSLDEAEAEEKRKEEEARKDEIIATLDIRLKDFLGSINI